MPPRVPPTRAVLSAGQRDVLKAEAGFEVQFAEDDPLAVPVVKL